MKIEYPYAYFICTFLTAAKYVSKYYQRQNNTENNKLNTTIGLYSVSFGSKIVMA